jgi:uroporphyrinogen decarboxylase
MSGAQTKPLLRALAGEILRRPPWWLMRQAGRYLPEYRELRSQAPDFVTFCLTPALAAEATLQPVRRFGMDAAILFADILLVPQALGQQLGFGDEGPLLEPIRDSSGVRNLRLDQLFACTEPVCETARLSRAKLPPETALIGFAGAPWTVATYMVEGGASKDFRHTKTWAYRDPEGFAALIELITEATIRRRSCPAVRQLGRGIASGGVRAMGDRTDPSHRHGAERTVFIIADHRLPARCRAAL